MKGGVLAGFTKFAGGRLCRGLIFCVVNFAGGEGIGGYWILVADFRMGGWPLACVTTPFQSLL